MLTAVAWVGGAAALLVSAMMLALLIIHGRRERVWDQQRADGERRVRSDRRVL